MLKKVDIGVSHGHEVFGNPGPLGLLGLAIATSALVPLSLGYFPAEGPKATFITAAIWALLFGGGCQFLAGIMDFANKNSFGGTIFTCFSFMWAKNAWFLYLMANGFKPDHYIDISTDVTLLAIFAVLTYGFGFFSKILFLFLLDIDLIFLCRLLRATTGTTMVDYPLALFTALMGIIGFWMAMGALINPIAGRVVFPMTGPLFFATKKERFDWHLRNHLFTILYKYWRDKAFVEMPLKDLEEKMANRSHGKSILPDLFYLWEFGYLHLSFEDGGQEKIKSARLNASGIDLFEQLILKKYQWH